MRQAIDLVLLAGARVLPAFAQDKTQEDEQFDGTWATLDSNPLK
jgi:hypothetical protein